MRIDALALQPIRLKSSHIEDEMSQATDVSHLTMTLYQTPSKPRTLKFDRNGSNSRTKRIKRALVDAAGAVRGHRVIGEICDLVVVVLHTYFNLSL